ncbi:uncharacterized protein LOC113461296 [Phoenix dactylifera]|uniref:Uncharacterized protein LOC113461296 n=1 Tax=Phoenix dactylifera TaxID=42345 RepID=A0A8B9A4D1_PHODC|nr:uncharacterized protein LOC113461296 [Phoenix dactylifera]XP_038981492.1 uncharacterized protein LOC113461296 [Phoenix dactylifera]
MMDLFGRFFFSLTLLVTIHEMISWLSLESFLGCFGQQYSLAVLSSHWSAGSDGHTLKQAYRLKTCSSYQLLGEEKPDASEDRSCEGWANQILSQTRIIIQRLNRMGLRSALDFPMISSVIGILVRLVWTFELC